MDKKKRDELIIKHAALVKNIVARMVAKLPINPSDKEDLLNVGVMGLILALDNFDPARNVRFETYATYRIRGAVLDELRAKDYLPRQARKKNAHLEVAVANLQKILRRPPEEDEIADYMELSLEEYHSHLDEAKSLAVLYYEDLSPDFLETYSSVDIVCGVDGDDPFVLFSNKQIRALIKKAIDNLPEKEKLVLSLYYVEELTMKEIGKVLDLTESRVCQLHSQAIIRIRACLQEHF